MLSWLSHPLEFGRFNCWQVLFTQIALSYEYYLYLTWFEHKIIWLRKQNICESHLSCILETVHCYEVCHLFGGYNDTLRNIKFWNFFDWLPISNYAVLFHDSCFYLSRYTDPFWDFSINTLTMYRDWISEMKH